MMRQIIRKAGLVAALGCAAAILAPLSAQAAQATTAAAVSTVQASLHSAQPTVITASVPRVPQVPLARWVWSGRAYSDTSQGRAACEREGRHEVSKGYLNFQCVYDIPIKHMLNLWLKLPN